MAQFCLRSAVVLTAAAALLAPIGASSRSGEPFWPQWRGPDATGVAPAATPPIEWSETTNIRWKRGIPGRGFGTPVIWGDRIFLTTAVPVGAAADDTHAPRGMVKPREPHRFVVLALDRRDGRVLWERTAREEVPHEGAHQMYGTWASSSAVTDGEVVVASFESRGLFAFDLDGKPVWQKDLGRKQMRNEFGEGSSPALHGNHLVVVWDHQGQSFIVALDKRTGRELWRRDRDEIDSWATPLVVTVNGRAQVVTGAMNRVQSYDLETGEVVWHTEGLTMNPIPTPVAGHGLVFLTSGFRGNSLKAIRLEAAKGDLTGGPAIAWTLDRDTPYVPSPLLYDDVLYILKSNNGLLSAFEARTGKPLYQVERIESAPNVFASPVGAAGRIYIAGQDGTTAVLRHGRTFEVLAANRLDDRFDASPALAGDTIYLRGHRSLYAIAGK